MTVEYDPEKHEYKIEGVVKYDFDKGELTEVNGIINRVIKVRQQLLDDVVLLALIIELERRGYTVISPEPKTEIKCPRGVTTVEDHIRQRLTHRWIDGHVTCMDVELAQAYDEHHNL